jgi:1-acyl-sn-glycerol-3-phosphate acyltransferase
MVLLRSLIYFLSLSVSIVVYATPIVLVGWLIGTRRTSDIANSWGRANLFLLKWICGLDYEVKGLDNIPAGGYIALSKHQSAWETIALRAILPGDQCWVLKRELQWIPVFGWAVAISRPIGIDRKSGRTAVRQIVEHGSRCLKQGRAVVIFPEGTRVAPGQRKRYGIGGALLAEKSGYPVVPIAHNAGVFWRRRGLRKYPGTVQVVIGPVIDSRGLRAQQINGKIEDWIENTVAKLPGATFRTEQFKE